VKFQNGKVQNGNLNTEISAQGASANGMISTRKLQHQVVKHRKV